MNLGGLSVDKIPPIATPLKFFLVAPLVAGKADIAKRSLKEGRTLRELVLEDALVDPAELERILDFRSMTEPGVA